MAVPRLSQGSATARTSMIGAHVGLVGWTPFTGRIERCPEQDNLTTFFEDTLGLKILEIQPNGASMLETPVFLAHNTDDDPIDVRLSQQARDVLLGLRMKIIWNEERDGGNLGMLKIKGLEGVAAFLQGAIGLHK